MPHSVDDLKNLEIALLKDASVHDCAVRPKTNGHGATRIVAYVVPMPGFSEESASARLREVERTNLVPDAYVLLSALPTTTDGQIDDERLSTFGVIDRDLAHSWQQRVRSIPGVADAAVVLRDHVPEERALHISDLLLDGARAAAVESAAEVIPAARQSVAAPGSQSQKPAISNGGPLRNPENVVATLPLALKRAAESPNGITYVNADGSETSQTYAALLDDAERILGGLRRLGLQAGDPVIFQLPDNRDVIPAFWACQLGGFLPAPLSIPSSYAEPNSTISKIHNCWDLLGRPVVLTSGRIAADVVSLSSLLGLQDFRVEQIEDLRASSADHTWHQSQPDDVCLLLFTSGSTGQPKGVQQCHRSLLGRSAATAERNDFSARDVSINWFPLDHVGGLVMFHLMDLFTCASQIQVPTDLILQNPLKWLHLIERFRATITWAPNFAFGLINDHEEEIQSGQWDLSSMRFILNGGEAIVAKTARRFLELLAPHGLRADAMHPSWGMSETCSGVAFSERCRRDIIRDEDSFVEVGAPIAGTSFRIVDSSGRLLEEDQIGSLQIKGTPVTSGYYKNPGLNEEVFTADGWFNTGDLALLHEGRLTITGRTKDVIIVNGVNFYSHELEAVVESVEGVDVSFTAACPVRVAGRDTDLLAIFFSTAGQEPSRLLVLLKAIREALLRKAGVRADFLLPLPQAEIPKTAIGKIQRSKLRERFERGEFAGLLKEIDIQTANANTLPDWFYQKTWRRRELTVRNGDLSGGYLVFADGLGLAQSLCDGLARKGAQVVRVDAGSAFQRVSEGHYALDPESPEAYRRLIDSLRASGGLPGKIIHLWAYDKSDESVSSVAGLRASQYKGVYSLLWLVQALARGHASADGIQLFAVTANAQVTSPHQAQISPERATISGFLATCPQELSWLGCQHIDLELAPPDDNARHLLDEVQAPVPAAEVVYREGHRLVGSLSKVDMHQAPTRASVQEGGLYLLTGGLGGLGTELALHLIQKHRAKLILVGRTAFPKREDWHRAEGTVAKRIENYERIERAGGEFEYRSIDLTSTSSIRSVIAQAEERWKQPLAGVFHLAGSASHSDSLEEHWESADSRSVAREPIENFEWIFDSKVYGTWALLNALPDRPDLMCVMFSSLYALFGAASLSAYSAANSFLDCMSLAHHRSHPLTYCLDWSMWNDLGMSEATPGYARQIARNMGYRLMSTEQGINSMLAVLARDHAHVLIGVDGASPHLRRYVGDSVYSTRELATYYVPTEPSQNGGAASELAALAPDGAPSHFVAIPAMPRNASGQIDRARLANMDRHAAGGSGQITEARNPVEEQIAGMWRDVLAKPQINIDDNFFELGGDSLAATRLINRLRESFQVNLSVGTLFDNPTIAALAVVVASKTSDLDANRPARTAGAQLSSASDLLNNIDQLSDEEVNALLAGMADGDLSQ